MMRLTSAMLLLLLLPAAFAEPLYDYDELTLELTLENKLTLTETGRNPFAEYVQADLSWYPRDTYRQEVTRIETTPQAALNYPSYEYRWERPAGELPFGLTAVVETTSEPKGVPRKVDFPITNLPSDIARYTRETEMIDINDDIVQQALELSLGKDDLFEVVYTIADWVTTNITYNLSTLTAEATQPSSWVMENRQGVCDEMTGLFISMLRALGIPARFVSGLSFTNLPEFPDPWGGHGWAEVWFPDSGWVPFDVTYGTYGYVDATHIKLQDSYDSQTRSVEFVMKGRDLKLQTERLATSVEVLDRHRKPQRFFTVDVEPYSTKVGFDSYNMLTATVTNNAQSYLSLRLTLAHTQGLETDAYDKNVMLKPLETKEVRWVVKTRNLRDGFLYTFPIKVYAGQREIATTEFQSRSTFDEYEESFFARFIERIEEAPVYEGAAMECEASEERLYVGGEASVTCSFTNNGDRDLWGLVFCINEECVERDVMAGGTITNRIERACNDPGVRSFVGSVTNDLVLEHALARFHCVDEASVRFTNITYPEALGFDEVGEIAFTVDKASESVPENLELRIVHDNFDHEWLVEELAGPNRFTLRVMGGNLDIGDNTFLVRVTFSDPFGKEYAEERQFTVAARDFTLLQKFGIHLANLQRWLSGLFA